MYDTFLLTVYILLLCLPVHHKLLTYCSVFLTQILTSLGCEMGRNVAGVVY